MAALNDLLEQNMSKLALYVPLEAKPGKEKEVAEFLKSALRERYRNYQLFFGGQIVSLTGTWKLSSRTWPSATRF